MVLNPAASILTTQKHGTEDRAKAEGDSEMQQPHTQELLGTPYGGEGGGNANCQLQTSSLVNTFLLF